MDHVVYLDAAAKELDQLLVGSKTMIVRGATGRKLPYGKVNPGDTLYFILNNSEGLIRAKARVQKVTNSEKLSVDESKAIIEKNQTRLQLTKIQATRWAGKRYLVLIGLEQVEEVQPFKIDKTNFGTMDDWLPVGDIDIVKIIQS